MPSLPSLAEYNNSRIKLKGSEPKRLLKECSWAEEEPGFTKRYREYQKEYDLHHYSSTIWERLNY